MRKMILTAGMSIEAVRAAFKARNEETLNGDLKRGIITVHGMKQRAKHNRVKREEAAAARNWTVQAFNTFAVKYGVVEARRMLLNTGHKAANVEAAFEQYTQGRPHYMSMMVSAPKYHHVTSNGLGYMLPVTESKWGHIPALIGDNDGDEVVTFKPDGIVHGLETGLIEEIEDVDSWIGDLKSLWGED